MQANLIIISIILKSMLIAMVVWTRLQSFCFTSDIGWEVRGGEERSPREVQRQGGGETWSSKASNQHTGISFYSYCANFIFFCSQLDEQRVRARHKTGQCQELEMQKSQKYKLLKDIMTLTKRKQHSFRFSAKEGATRPDQARPRTNIQVLTKKAFFDVFP